MALLRQKPPLSQSVPPSAPCGLAQNSAFLFFSLQREWTFKEKSQISHGEGYKEWWDLLILVLKYTCVKCVML